MYAIRSYYEPVVSVSQGPENSPKTTRANNLLFSMQHHLPLQTASSHRITSYNVCYTKLYTGCQHFFPQVTHTWLDIQYWLSIQCQDRIVFVGDSGVSRLYKDGIGAAYSYNFV